MVYDELPITILHGQNVSATPPKTVTHSLLILFRLLLHEFRNVYTATLVVYQQMIFSDEIFVYIHFDLL